MRRFLSERVDYDERLHAVYHQASEVEEADLVPWTAAFGAFLDPSPRVVDVGSGTGRWAAFLADHLGATVIGVEPSSAMRAEAERLSARPSVTYVAGTAEALPVDGAAFDAALLSRVLAHLVDLDTAASEVARSLRPGGMCLISAVFGDRLNDDSPLYRFWPQLRRIDQARYPTLREVLVSFRDAGLSDVTVEPVTSRVAPSLAAYRERAAMRGLSKFEYLTDEEFDRGLAAIDGERGGIDQPVEDRIELLVLKRRPAPVRSAPGRTRRWSTGEVATLRGLYRDATVADDIETVVDAKPVVAARDDDHHCELWLPAGTPTRRPVGLSPRLPRPWVRGDCIVEPGSWDWCSALVIHVPEEWRTTWVLWSPTGAFMGWMVDLDRPLRRDALGFVVDGLQLDLVVNQDRSWRWKDQHELDRAVALGFVTEADAARARAEGDRAVADIEAGRWPFTDEWRTWRPDPGWPAPSLPTGWWRASARDEDQ